jgi:NADPH:quinone reductase-like Zn-dependent oxidoreductase
MRAVVHDRYGPPEVLRVAEVERPVPKEGEVLVRVQASTVTRSDTGLRSAEYPFTRLITGIRRPKRTIAGWEFAGLIEKVGAAVTDFRVGDEVFGIEGGANAEYVTARESGVIAQKPTGLTYEEAAAVPDGSLLALTCLRPAYPLRGQSVLVYGAAGSIGTGGSVTRSPLRGRGDGGVRHERRRARAVAGRAGRPRSLSR